MTHMKSFARSLSCSLGGRLARQFPRRAQPPSSGAASGGGHAEGAARLADHLLGEAPFVVVPGHHLDQRGVHDPGQLQVDDGGARVTNNVGGDQRILRYAENSLVLL